MTYTLAFLDEELGVDIWQTVMGDWTPLEKFYELKQLGSKFRDPLKAAVRLAYGQGLDLGEYQEYDLVSALVLRIYEAGHNLPRTEGK